MKKLLTTLSAMAIVVMAGTAMAADTATLTVSATVQGACSFNTVGTLAFGVLDPVAAPAVSITNNGTTFTCSNGTPYTITDDDGLNELAANANRMRSTTLGTPEYIPYTVAYAAAGTGTGLATPLSVTGNIAAGSYAANSPDVYNDTVTLTITP